MQNLANHTRYSKGFHYVILPLLFLGTIASLVNLWLQISMHDEIFTAILLALLFTCASVFVIQLRRFALKAQDRAIRAEENFRHYVLTHKLLDSKLAISQIIALRFAPDDEFVVLADRAARENLSPDEIKKAIRNWKADEHRA